MLAREPVGPRMCSEVPSERRSKARGCEVQEGAVGINARLRLAGAAPGALHTHTGVKVLTVTVTPYHTLTVK